MGLSLPHSCQRAAGLHKGPIATSMTNVLTLAFQWTLGSCLMVTDRFSMVVIMKNQASLLWLPFVFLMNPRGMCWTLWPWWGMAGREHFLFRRLLAVHRSFTPHRWSPLEWLALLHISSPHTYQGSSSRWHSISWNLLWGQVKDRLGGTQSQGKGPVLSSDPLVPFVEIVCWYSPGRSKCLSLLSLLLVQLEVSKVPDGDILTHIFPHELHPESSPPVGLERVPLSVFSSELSGCPE